MDFLKPPGGSSKVCCEIGFRSGGSGLVGWGGWMGLGLGGLVGYQRAAEAVTLRWSATVAISIATVAI